MVCATALARRISEAASSFRCVKGEAEAKKRDLKALDRSPTHTLAHIWGEFSSVDAASAALFGSTAPPGATQVDQRVGKSQGCLHLLPVKPDQTATQQEVDPEACAVCCVSLLSGEPTRMTAVLLRELLCV